MGDVIVVLPGILGSALAKDGKEVWAPNGGAVWRFLKSRSASITGLALDDHDDGSLDDLGDGVTATRLMPDIHLVPAFWAIDGYGEIRTTLLDTFTLTEGANYFEFPYDWRRSNRAHGRRLRKESEGWLRTWRSSSGNDKAELILLAHSMGGLVARSFLELEGGWSDTSALITFGTPYSGSLNALDFIANGFKKGIGPVAIDLSDLLRSLTSVYELLPTYPCVTGPAGDDPLHCTDPSLAIPFLDPARAAAGLGFHQKLDDAASAADAQRIHPIVGIRQSTKQRAALGSGPKATLTISSVWDAANPELDLGGDGTVPRRSATPPEIAGQLKGTMYSAVKHGSLQNAVAVLAHVEGVLTENLLLEQQAGGVPFLAFDLDDDYFAVGEDVAVRIRTSEVDISFVVTVVDEELGQPLQTRSADNLDGADEHTVVVSGLAEGTYRIVLTAPGVDVAPVSRVVVVWSD
jgi:hypothetical protein